RLEQPHRRIEGGILRLRQIGRIRDDGTIALPRERREQVALTDLDRDRRPHQRYVLACECRRLRRALDRDHTLEGALDAQRQGDAATPGPDVSHHTTHPASRLPPPEIGSASCREESS